MRVAACFVIPAPAPSSEIRQSHNPSEPACLPGIAGFLLSGVAHQYKTRYQTTDFFSKNLKAGNDPPASQPDGHQPETQYEGGSTCNHPGEVVRIGLSADEVKVNFFYKAQHDRCKRCSNDAKRRRNCSAGQASKKMDYFLFLETWLVRFHVPIIVSQPV